MLNDSACFYIHLNTSREFDSIKLEITLLKKSAQKFEIYLNGRHNGINKQSQYENYGRNS